VNGTAYVVKSVNGPRYLLDGCGSLRMGRLKEAYVFVSRVSANIEMQRYETWREVRELFWRVKTRQRGILFKWDCSTLAAAREKCRNEGGKVYRVARKAKVKT